MFKKCSCNHRSVQHIISVLRLFQPAENNRALKSKQYVVILLAGKTIWLLHTILMEDKRRVHLLQNNFLSHCPVDLTPICMCAN